MIIEEVKENKKIYIDLLLIADEQEDMIDKYLNQGRMFVLNDNGVKGVCVITDEEKGVLEIKNIAVKSEYQKMGYGKALINFIISIAKDNYSVLCVGTGDSPLTIPFYEKLGFHKSHIIKNFFVENYKNPIYESGVRLIDMIYLKMNL